VEDGPLPDQGKNERRKSGTRRRDERPHLFADRYFGYDDAIYASCRLIELLSGKDQKLSQLLNDVPKTLSPLKFEWTARTKSNLKSLRGKRDAGKDNPIIDVDGVRVKFEDGWGLVRPSNTQPVLVLRFEALTEKRLQEIRKLVEDRVNVAVSTLE